MKLVTREVSKVSHVITYCDKLENRIYSKLERYLSSENGDIRHVKKLRKIVFREISVARNLFGLQGDIAVFSDIVTDEEEYQFEPVDTLASVDKHMEIKTIIELLAQDDNRKKFILNSWLEENFNDSDIARGLASVFGGTVGKHRHFIQRYKNDCKTILKVARTA